MKTEKNFIEADRYLFDFYHCSTKKGYAQLDTSQDASYYGTWTNPLKELSLLIVKEILILKLLIMMMSISENCWILKNGILNMDISSKGLIQDSIKN